MYNYAEEVKAVSQEAQAILDIAENTIKKKWCS